MDFGIKKSMKCDKCGKKIKNKHRYELTVPPIEGKPETYIWCEDCYKEFTDSLNKPSKSFQNVKPATIDMEKIKTLIKSFDKNF